MTLALPSIAEWRDVDVSRFRAEILPRQQPAVLRGVAAHWPAVAAGKGTASEASAYLSTFDRGGEAEAFIAPRQNGGRYFYTPDLGGFNFERRRGRFADILRSIAAASAAADAPSIYAGAVPAAQVLPGFAEANPITLNGPDRAEPRIWIGTASEVSTHFDLSDNLACVVSGRRRFTIFPPDQLANLYVGPLDHTMAGQPASLVPLHAPDFDRFPRFRDALAAAQSAELEPGDAIYLPPLWWHHVDALSPFNILVNYWWDEGGTGGGAAFEAMVHGILAMADMPPERRVVWRGMFDHYVFRTGGDPAEHLAPEQRGILGAPTPQLKARIRQFLMRALGRG